MERIKVSENFYLDEFIHPNIYKQWGERSKRYLNPKLIDLVQGLRDDFGSITINNWATGGSLINSGLRDFQDPLGGKLNRSGHYYGNCADLKFGSTTPKKAYAVILKTRTEWRYSRLTTLEDINYTPTWLHVSVEWTDKSEIVIVKP